MKLTLEQRMTAIAMVEYLREQGYILSPTDKLELEQRRAADDEYLCGKDAAEMIGCSPQYITKLKAQGVLKYYLKGSDPMYSVKSLKKYISSRTVTRGKRG
jgi:hypothetical protein